MSPRLRFHAPPRAEVGRDLVARPPFDRWSDCAPLLTDAAWPSCAELDAWRRAASARDGIARPAFVAQTPGLLADGLHYERRIAERGLLATREGNWHDLFNALVWLRQPLTKRALNARQIADLAVAGPARRTRAQCALTHFDEAGVLVACADPALLAQWDAHDWEGLFGRERAAWGGRIAVQVFGHALLEHALRPRQLVVAKALAFAAEAGFVAALAAGEAAAVRRLDAAAAARIEAGAWLADPQELRPLPLSGIPGWHPGQAEEGFLRTAPCFRPLRPGRRYPPPPRLQTGGFRAGTFR
jgi:hypothetical protein